MKKQTFKNCLKLGILLYLISLLVVSCSNETTEIQLTEIQKIEKEFSFKNFNDDSVKNNLVINWNDFILKQDIDTISNDKVYEFNTSSKINTSIDNGKQKLAVKYKLLVSKNDSEQWDFELIKFLSNNSESIDNISYFNPTSFSGTLYHYNLNGENIKIKAYKNGELLSEFPDKEKDVISAQARVPCVGGDTGGGGFWMFTRTKHYTDWYTGSNTTSWTYTHSVHNYTTSEYVWVSTGGGGGSSNGDYHAHRGEHEADNHPVEVIIAPSFLNTKAGCVYEKLEQLNGNLFKKTIGSFINDPNYDLVLKVGNCATTNDACTDTSNIDVSGDITITIEDINQSGLGIAALILHEGIHAEMHRYVSRYQSGIDPNNRKRLFQLYAYYKGWAESAQDEDYNWTQVAHHHYMVENYVKPIASAIRKLDNNRYPLNYYMAYAWDGLRDSGYTSKRLTKAEDTQYYNLRNIVEVNVQICN